MFRHPTLIPLLLLCLAAAIPARAAAPVVTAVFSRTTRDYQRSRQADGSFKAEYYVIANGKYAPGAGPNESIDKVGFPQIAGLVAQHLAGKQYFLAPTAATADFLLHITWGTTITHRGGTGEQSLATLGAAVAEARQASGALTQALAAPEGGGVREAAAASNAANDTLESALLVQQMYELDRRQLNEKNARLLGYIDEINDRDNASRFAGAGTSYDELIEDIESDRYYVIVTAYDFRKLAEEGKQEVKWSTCVSIEAQGNRFDEMMAQMVAAAARHFGQDSQGLVRRPEEGSVQLGELKFLGTAGGQEGAAAPAPPGKERR